MLYYAFDFETTVEDDTATQTYTECWACAYCNIYNTSDFGIFGNIYDFLNYFLTLDENITSWFHNVKFDGSFILDALLNHGFQFRREDKNHKLLNKEFDVLITTQNRWYMIKIKYNNHTLTIYDSVKLMPMTLKEVGESFNTKHQKLEMNYKGNHYANCEIKPNEQKYILNDVFVLAEGLKIMLELGNNKMTTGANALNMYKKQFFHPPFELEWNEVYVNLKNIKLEEEFYKVSNADEYIRKAYKGGWCYLNPEYQGIVIIDGDTFDVNSLYPSVMHSKSGNIYPIGFPHFFNGKDFNNIKNKENIVYFITIRCIFNLKEGYLPTVQIKNDFKYKSTQWLTTSDIVYRGTRKQYIETENGVERIKAELTLTNIDFKLFCEHYVIEELEILHGCWFEGLKGLYDEYIDYHMEIKMHSTGGIRTEAKLKQNSLYGKLSSSTDSSYMEPYLDEDGILQFIYHEEHNKKLISIAHGAMVTSYARYFTISHAQKHYDSFIYSDTDSIHLLNSSEFLGQVHNSNLLCWKHESHWKRGKFIRQKTYIEEVEKEDGSVDIEIKCAGMSEKAKEKFKKDYDINKFDYGLEVEGNLKPKRIKGGTVLVESPYKLRK